MSQFSITIEQDENGDVILPFPSALIEKYGWQPGDQIEWEIIPEGARIINRSAEQRNK